MVEEVFVLGDCTLYYGDCVEVMKELDDNSITLIHTDPPYVIHSDDNMGAMMEKKAVTGNMEKSRRAYRMAPKGSRAVRMRLQPLGNPRGILRRSNGI